MWLPHLKKYVELLDAFAEEVNAKVEFLSMSSGEVIARVEAEGGKPMADLLVWWRPRCLYGCKRGRTT